MSASIAIETENLGLKVADRWLFRNLKLQVPRGAFYCVEGPSGVGKSSLLSCISGLKNPSEGRSQVHADTSTQDKRCGCTIGTIFQNFLLVENASVIDNVMCGRLGHYCWLQTLFGMPRHLRQQAFEILEQLGLSEHVHQCTGECSGGEQQRVAVARALFQNADVILADEPISQLDKDLSRRVLDLLREQAHQSNKAVLCVLHDQALANEYADAILELNPEQAEDWNLRQSN